MHIVMYMLPLGPSSCFVSWGMQETPSQSSGRTYVPEARAVQGRIKKWLLTFLELDEEQIVSKNAKPTKELTN